MGHKTYMYFLFFIPQQNSSEENTAFIQVQTCSLQVYVIFVFSDCSSINSSKVVDSKCLSLYFSLNMQALDTTLNFKNVSQSF